MKHLLVQFIHSYTDSNESPIQIPESFTPVDLTKYLNLATQNNQKSYNFYVSNVLIKDSLESFIKEMNFNSEEILKIEVETIVNNEDPDYESQFTHMINCLKIINNMVLVGDCEGNIYEFNLETKIKKLIYEVCEYIVDIDSSFVLTKYRVINLKSKQIIIDEEWEIMCFCIFGEEITYFTNKKIIRFDIKSRTKKVFIENILNVTKIEVKNNLIYISSLDKGFMVLNYYSGEAISTIVNFASNTFFLGNSLVVGGIKGKIMSIESDAVKYFDVKVRFISHVLVDEFNRIIYCDQYNIFFMNRSFDGHTRFIRVEDEINGMVMINNNLIVTSKNNLKFFVIKK